MTIATNTSWIAILTKMWWAAILNPFCVLAGSFGLIEALSFMPIEALSTV